MIKQTIGVVWGRQHLQHVLYQEVVCLFSMCASMKTYLLPKWIFLTLVADSIFFQIDSG